MTNEGFKAGLKYWLVFLLVFYFLGYPVELSIFLSGLAGFAGGFLAAGWQVKELPKIDQDSSEEKPDNAFTRATKRFRLQANQTGQSVNILPKWLRGRERRSLKSPRR